eukprot:s2174_g8.t1
MPTIEQFRLLGMAFIVVSPVCAASHLRSDHGVRRQIPTELTMEAFMMPSVQTGVASQTRGHLRPSQHGAVVHAGPEAPSSAPSHGSVVGTWAALGASLALAQRGTRTARRSTETEKEAFDVWQPSTYGNITMDDVKKYGAAGTLSYVITELIFWAVAFPTEIFIYLQTAGHWPDFSKPEESAAVFGMVFAASNIARLLLPLRFGAALAMAPWVDENIMQRFSEPQATDSATATPVTVPVPVSNMPRAEENENELRAYLMQN